MARKVWVTEGRYLSVSHTWEQVRGQNRCGHCTHGKI